MKISAMGIGTSRDIEPSPNCWRKDCVVIRRSCDHELKDQLLDDLEIDPLSRRLVFLISQQIIDRHLKHVFARRKIAADLDATAANESFHFGLVSIANRILFSGDDRLAVAEKA